VEPSLDAYQKKELEAKLSRLKKKVLDLTTRNPLISTNLQRSSSLIRVVDQSPDKLADKLSEQKSLKILPLPEMNYDPKDENNITFLKAFEKAKAACDGADFNQRVKGAKKEALNKLERQIKDQVRKDLNMPVRLTKMPLSLEEHAKNNGINSSFDLSSPWNNDEDARAYFIQTLLFQADLVRILTNLMTKYRTWEQETGINAFHAVFGFLKWDDPAKKTSCHSPLLLVPVKLIKTNTAKGPSYTVRAEGDDVALNFILAEKLKLDYGVTLPDYDPSQSIESYFELVRKSQGGDLNWSISNQVVLGIFPSSSLAIYKDLDAGNEWLMSSDAVKELLYIVERPNVGKPGQQAPDYNVDDPDIEEKVDNLVLSADSSQISTIYDVINGRSIAVEGPPGTGKSQTIVNTICQALSCGKKVLFVAEKQAALEVVKSRLEAVGLGEFLLPLQAKRSERSQVIESLRQRIEMVPPWLYDSERENLVRERLKRVKGRLNGYADMVSFKFGTTGLTIFEIIGRTLQTAHAVHPDLNTLQCPTSVNLESLNEICVNDVLQAARNYEKACLRVKDGQTYWEGVNLTNLDPFLADKLLSDAKKLAERFEDSFSKEKSALKHGLDKESISNISTLDNLIQFKTHLQQIDIKLFSYIYHNKLRHPLTSFVENCHIYKTESLELSKHLNNPEDENNSENINNLITNLNKLKKHTLDIKDINKEIEDVHAQIKIDKNIVESLKPLVDQWEDLAELSFGDLSKLSHLAEQAGPAALNLRFLHNFDSPALDVLSRLINSGASLSSAKEALKRVFLNPDETPEIDDLLDIKKVLEETGFLGRFFKSFKSAKASFLELTASGVNFDRIKAVSSLKSLIEWKRKVAEYHQNPQGKEVFLHYFKGIDTDFEPFFKLIAYYNEIKLMHNFRIVENLEILACRKDAALLLSIGDLSHLDPFSSYKKTTENICELELKHANLCDVQKIFTRLTDESKAPNLDLTTLQRLAQLVKEHLTKKNELCNNHCAEQALGAELFKGPDTDENSITAPLSAVNFFELLPKPVKNWLLALLEKCPSKDQALDTLQDAIEALESLHYSFDETKSLLSELEKNAQIDFTQKLKGRNPATFFQAASMDRSGLLSFSAISAARQEIKNCNFTWLIDALEKAELPLTNLDAFFEAFIYRSMMIYVMEKYNLSKYNVDKLNASRQSLSQYDKELLKLNKEKLKHYLYNNAALEQGSSSGLKKNWTEMALIENELNKKTKHIPIRQLVTSAPRSLQELKPCFMMSPAAVSQYLASEKIRFDLCILDEASQMPPENAIASIARCKQAMIVGDTNQLPPTTFFKKHISDDYDDDDDSQEEYEIQEVEEESILELAQKIFKPTRRLLWHYRSKHSGLIQFSNRQVYDSSLVIYPSPSERRKDMGIKQVKVDGIYKSNKNELEAQTMVQAALNFMKNHNKRSLGLVTLNQKQRDLIIEMLEDELENDDDARNYIDDWETRNDGLESFFVKNLENVQGDERDVIYIGTVYGPEAPGKTVKQRFGPILGKAGRRRLNVLFSRAKEQIVTFTSMTPADIKGSQDRNSGEDMLKEWLDYSDNQNYSSPISKAQNANTFAAYLQQLLSELGYQADLQVGTDRYRLDVALNQSDELNYFFGIESDGPSWHQTASARDRDGLRDEVLTALGWKLYRAWSISWLNDPQGEAAKLKEAIEKHLKANPRISALKPKPHIDENQEIDDSAVDKILEIGDMVRIKYLSGQIREKWFTLTKDVNSIKDGLTSVKSPLGKAIYQGAEGHETTFQIGKGEQEVRILEIIKAKDKK
jgi:transcription elongation GreA/GreB family factor